MNAGVAPLVAVACFGDFTSILKSALDRKQAEVGMYKEQSIRNNERAAKAEAQESMLRREIAQMHDAAAQAPRSFQQDNTSVPYVPSAAVPGLAVGGNPGANGSSVDPFAASFTRREPPTQDTAAAESRLPVSHHRAPPSPAHAAGQHQPRVPTASSNGLGSPHHERGLSVRPLQDNLSVMTPPRGDAPAAIEPKPSPRSMFASAQQQAWQRQPDPTTTRSPTQHHVQMRQQGASYVLLLTPYVRR